MIIPEFKRVPKHIGFIPDGNRRWAQGKGLPKQAGYYFGIDPGFDIYNICLELGINEITFYGFTQDNTKRPTEQTRAFQKACVDAVMKLANKDAELLVIGNSESPMFPKELLPFTQRVKFGRGLIKVNFLVNYGWNWDLNYTLKNKNFEGEWNYDNLIKSIASSDISRIDLIVRWGGRRRLSGFLPVQSIYADFFILDELWPDFEPEQFYRALEWYQEQDVTLGG
ncbi:MAG: dihydroorotate dehydrogenase [Clostridiaceae bacterium BRH_c20a]|nr:MAG: dihydroorotate dehydrogenase [Clostridiaceae bacterium BRH_c20a]